MKKVLSLVCLFVMVCSGLFAVPNMANYAGHPNVTRPWYSNGVIQDSFASCFDCEPTVVDGSKVYVGYEPASMTLVKIGRRGVNFYCELIDKNGVKESVAIPICNTHLDLRFSFPIGNRHWRTACECNILFIGEEDCDKVSVALYTIVYDPDLLSE